jgi:pyridinium-3,5-bisthiocarboxylic acid mononucleotide nickel chelatase
VKLAHIDAEPGATGALIVGAFVSAGWPVDALRERVKRLSLPVRVELVPQASANAFVLSADPGEKLTLRRAHGLLDRAGYSEAATLIAKGILAKWASAVAEIESPPRKDRFPFLAAIELALIAATACAIVDLGIDQVSASGLPLGRPASIPPVVTALLRGYPIRGTESAENLVAPEAAAILSTIAVQRGPMPPMVLDRVAHAAPPSDWPQPGALSLWIGTVAGNGALEARKLLLIETNIDDMNPEFYGHLGDQLFAAGALDVNLIPTQMKKGRPATLLSVLGAPENLDRLRGTMLRESSTLGVRVQEVMRYALPRDYRQVETEWGPVMLKVAHLPDGSQRAVPEYEDCRRLAVKTGEALWRIYVAAQALGMRSKVQP